MNRSAEKNRMIGISKREGHQAMGNDKDNIGIKETAANLSGLAKKECPPLDNREAQIVDWKTIDAILGTTRDAKVALHFKINAALVTHRRLSLEIPAFSINWNEIDPYLGSISDAEASKRFGVSISTITKRRKELNLEPYIRRIDWKDIDPLLGTMTDKQLSRKTGITKSAIIYRRKKLKIPAYMKIKIDWAKIDPLLGIMTDGDLSRIYNVSRTAVADRRRKLDIDSHSESENRKNIPWRIDWEGIDAFIGAMPDTALAEKFNISPTAVGRRRLFLRMPAYKKISYDISVIDGDINVLSDRKISAKYGIPFSSVKRYRLSRGIQSTYKRVNYDWRGIDPLLGKRSDKYIAREYGISLKAIRYRRGKLNIAAFSPISGAKPLEKKEEETEGTAAEREKLCGGRD
jgi:DNA-binding Lrp family transcriptional regulator